MGINFITDGIKDIKLGGGDIQKVYRGNDLVWQRVPDSVSYNGYTFVNMGTSVLWATTNIGGSTTTATNMAGKYFQLGDTQGYYANEVGSKLFDWAHYKWCNGTDKTLTKYCMHSGYGTVDNRRIIELSDDAAYVNIGPQCRMPTITEYMELQSACTVTDVTLLGVNCLQFKSKTTNNILYIPCGGYAENNTINKVLSEINHWGRDYDPWYGYTAWHAIFKSYNELWTTAFSYCYGLNIRAVMPI